MPRFKNIRIKMKGGKTRLQRVMVLPSGKYKFVKNLTKSRSNPKEKGKTSTKKTRPIKKGGNRKMGKQFGSRQIFSAAKKIAFVADAAMIALGPGSGQEKLKWGIRDYTGYNADTRKWEPGYMVNAYGPPIGVHLAQKLYTFINKILG